MRSDDGGIREGAALIDFKPQGFEDGFPSPGLRPTVPIETEVLNLPQPVQSGP